MERYICIHGHFYQPPRENAWLEFVEVQDSAYPFHDWNERITAECYAPNGMSRILDGDDNVRQNRQQLRPISFNFGPTLLAGWRKVNLMCIRRFSRPIRKASSAFPVTAPLSRSRTITRSFRFRTAATSTRKFSGAFGTSSIASAANPEGMWLPETAVDLEVLDILARLGIRFTILSPYQAKRVEETRGAGAGSDVSGGRVDPSTPYIVTAAFGQTIAVFFYDGPISQAIAFEGLLERGENLAGRLMSAFSTSGHGLRSSISPPTVKPMDIITGAATWHWLTRFTISKQTIWQS